MMIMAVEMAIDIIVMVIKMEALETSAIETPGIIIIMVTIIITTMIIIRRIIVKHQRKRTNMKSGIFDFKLVLERASIKKGSILIVK